MILNETLLVKVNGAHYRDTFLKEILERCPSFVQEEANLTRRYPREKTVERIAYIKELREQKKTIPQIREILQEKDRNA